MNWKGATTEGAIAAGVVALFGNLGLAVAVQFYGFSLPHGSAAEALTLLVAIVVMIAVSLVTSAKARDDIDDDIERVIDS
ncbi:MULTISPECIES: hypothetical protein [unclassified Halorubrum]|uniref:hypothetical protein n=1 Tax=unclassified Halorubrum TaxID=2642239 RepID=UPI000B98028B|nr:MULTISPECIES: hypothetical protein [unclassified Halorubrum]OYR40253.1 hypothetical protein DJ81_14845 [Halorubrum sp. Hd13]OYR51938.1 hypothetical protein DJ73_12090 [Halorubrum sp. Ea1]